MKGSRKIAHSQNYRFGMSFSSPIVCDILLLDSIDFVEVVLIRISFNLFKSHYKMSYRYNIKKHSMQKKNEKKREEKKKTFETKRKIVQ